jgi:hypothetical protein
MMDDILIVDTITADQIEVGDQLVIDDDLVIVKTVDNDREDIDEVFITVENLTTAADTEFPLYADDSYDVWSY